MALSKEHVNKVDEMRLEDITIRGAKILNLCQVVYKNAVSIEIISHLLGGENMDYITMEVEDSFQCYAYCRHKFLEFIQKEQKEILFFEDRKDQALNVIIAVLKQP